MYFQTSDDILTLVLTVTIAAVGIALVWLIVELIRIVRPFRKLVESVEHRLTRIDDALHAIRDKLVAVASTVPFVSSLFSAGDKRSGKKRKR